MDDPSRREFLGNLMSAGAVAALGRTPASAAAPPVRRRMTIDLICGNLGVKATQREAIDLARRHGFESVFPDAGELARLSDSEVAAVQADLKAARLVFGAAFLAVDFRKDEDTFARGLAELPAYARALQRAGVRRTGTWLPPSSDSLTYLQYFKQTARGCAKWLASRRSRSEARPRYVGPKTAWAARRYPFLHTRPRRELIAGSASRVLALCSTLALYHAGDSAGT
jgi:hypothetical protein